MGAPVFLSFPCYTPVKRSFRHQIIHFFTGFPMSAICTAKTFSDFEESPQYPSEKSGVVTPVPQMGMET